MIPLTKRQREVVEGVLSGETYAEIAHRLKISKRTVRMHIERIAGKYDEHGPPLRCVRRHARELLAA